MLSMEEMIIRLAVAIILGAAIGLEREFVGKEAGVRTNILVSSGAAIFSMIGLALPYLISQNNPELLSEILARNSGFLSIVANIVVGIGFLGAGIIIEKNGEVRGLTTAASVWFVAAIGILSGLGIIKFAVVSTVGIVILLIVLRKIDFFGMINKKERQKEFNN